MDVADGLAVQEMLNRALEEDKLDDGCVRCAVPTSANHG
jgi:hypothetical protein